MSLALLATISWGNAWILWIWLFLESALPINWMPTKNYMTKQKAATKMEFPNHLLSQVNNLSKQTFRLFFNKRTYLIIYSIKKTVNKANPMLLILKITVRKIWTILLRIPVKPITFNTCLLKTIWPTLHQPLSIHKAHHVFIKTSWTTLHQPLSIHKAYHVWTLLPPSIRQKVLVRSITERSFEKLIQQI